MTQALHIFRKDLRHQRVDLAIYAGLLVLTGLLVPTGWPGHHSWSTNDMLPLVHTLLQIAIPVFWLVMIARLVHEEAIVGDKQFWTTRPYRWNSLLGAKLLFVLVCIALPHFVMQWCLAFYAGVSPFQSGFPWSATMHLLIVWIPMFLFACITSTLVSTFFTTLGSVVIWLVMLALVIGRNGPEADAPYARLIFSVLFAGIFAFLLVLLYRTRSYQLGRILMGSSAVLFLLMIFFVSKMSPASLGTLLLKARYREGAAPQLHLHYVPGLFSGHNNQNSSWLLAMSVPIELLGLPNGNRLHNAAMQYHLEAGRYRYTSPWRPTALTPEGMTFRVPTEVMEHAGHADAHLTVSLAAEEIAPGTSQTTAIRDLFAIPGGGSCDAINPPHEGRSARTSVVCHFAYSVPYPIEIDATMASGCPIPKVPMQIPTYDGGTGFDPLTHWPVNFGPRGITGATRDCIVQSLTTTVYRPVTRFRTSLDIPSIRLADYLGH
ncbi:hypothetical protein [Terriglobus sp. ADX1]|uniref:hypothetical protein n=1 Tax=Terriglobus sp. ADX1 TaxID=2794063 RepID=UPI002FE67AD9